jgi:glycosyltransferase involved in cell wall biosynthesis
MSKQKQVLYIGGFELPDKNAAAQRVIANGKVFRDLGYSVYYLSPSRTIDNTRELNNTKAVFDGFTYYQVKYPARAIDWLLYLISINDVRKAISLLQNIKLIVAYNYPAVALLRLKKLCKTRGISLIADCTEWYMPQGNIFIKMAKSTDTFLRMRFVQPQLDGVIAISRYLYDFYNDRMKNVIQLPPLVDLTSEKWAGVLQYEGAVIRLVYAGSPGTGTKDRIDVIIAALNIVRKEIKNELLLNVIGLTKQQYLNNFSKQPTIQDIDKFVSFKGRLPHRDALNYVKNADYMIFVRDNNLANTAGFPTKFVEAFSCGTPILANVSSNLSDYLKNGEMGFVLDVANENSLVNSLKGPLQLSRLEINKIKSNVRNSQLFDYRSYLLPVNCFLDSVLEINA